MRKFKNVSKTYVNQTNATKAAEAVEAKFDKDYPRHKEQLGFPIEWVMAVNEEGRFHPVFKVDPHWVDGDLTYFAEQGFCCFF